MKWYGDKAKRGREAICAHLNPGDQKLRAALERQGMRFNDEATTVPVAVIPQNFPVRLGRVVRSHPWLVALACLLLLAVVAGLLVQVAPFAKASIQVRSISETHIAGFFVARQWTGGSARTLYAIDAHSGAYRPLWPNAAMLQGGSSSSGELGDFITDYAPAYLPARHLLAFIADNAHTPTIWLAHIQMGTDGWPQIVAPGPQELVENCGCNVLGWSASGDWLLYDTPMGITAISPNTLARQQATSDGKDRWPACSPNGAWLAVQNALDDIKVLPSRDCIPVPNAASSERYLNGFRVAWHPAWSADGTMLAFISDQGGQEKIYAIPLARLARNANLEETAPAFQLSRGGCMDPLWVTNQSTHEALVVFTCSPQASNPQHGSLIAVPGTSSPSWEGLLDEGTLGRDSLCWMPT